MLKKILILFLLAGVGLIFFDLFQSYQSASELTTTAKYYADNGAKEVGAANLVSAIVVTYRGLDTLGEVSILFVTAAIISFVLKHKPEEEDKNRVIKPASEILNTATAFLTPVIIMVGIYIFINGHLTPGGGFQGGAVIASAVLLIFLTNPKFHLNHSIIAFVESISGVAFVVIGALGLIMAGGFLDNRILGLGEFGTLFSAGALPVIYIFIGLKVGAELSNIVGILAQEQNIKN
jgi:multicomponent Na+:H+ antiporter subunit B